MHKFEIEKSPEIPKTSSQLVLLCFNEAKSLLRGIDRSHFHCHQLKSILIFISILKDYAPKSSLTNALFKSNSFLTNFKIIKAICYDAVGVWHWNWKLYTKRQPNKSKCKMFKNINRFIIYGFLRIWNISVDFH